MSSPERREGRSTNNRPDRMLRPLLKIKSYLILVLMLLMNLKELCTYIHTYIHIWHWRAIRFMFIMNSGLNVHLLF